MRALGRPSRSYHIGQGVRGSVPDYGSLGRAVLLADPLSSGEYDSNPPLFPPEQDLYRRGGRPEWGQGCPNQSSPPGKYDGTGHLTEYLSHFDLCRLANGWTSEEAGVFIGPKPDRDGSADFGVSIPGIRTEGTRLSGRHWKTGSSLPTRGPCTRPC